MKIHRAVAMFLLLVLIASCQTQPQEKIKIGVVTPLTGGAAFLGENVLRSAELTLIEYGLTDRFELVVQDVPCGGHGPTAVKAVSKLVDVDDVQFIVGGMCSDETLAVAPIVNEANTVLIMPLTGGKNIDTAGEFIFRNGPSDVLAGTLPARDFNMLKMDTVALVTDQAAYTLDIVTHFKETFKGTIVVDEQVSVGETDLRSVVTKIKASEVEAVLINTQDGVSGAYLVKQLNEQEVNLPVFGNFLTHTHWLDEVAGEASEGIYIYDPEFDYDSPEVVSFFSAYEQRFSESPSILFHTTGVRDAILMFAQATEVMGDDGSKVHDWLLENIQDWHGFNGVVSFDGRGNSGTGFVLKQRVDGELVIVE